MWTMSDEYYISVSQLRLFEEDRVEWWKRYVGGGSSFRQTLPMGVGTCFDWLVKRSLCEDMDVQDHGPSAEGAWPQLRVGDTLVGRSVDLEETVADEAWRLGHDVLAWYKACGAYAGLVERYAGCKVWLDQDVTCEWSVGDGPVIRVRGKSDLTAIGDGPDGPQIRIGDWKVKGSASGASPSKGWSLLWEAKGIVKGTFPGPPSAGAQSVVRESDGSLPAVYADQISMYGVTEEESLGGRFVGGEIYECVCRKTGVRVAEYRGMGTDRDALYCRLVAMWEQVQSGSVLTDEQIEILEQPDWGAQFGL